MTQSRSISTATVVGAGTMGIGIAQVLSTSGIRVHVIEPNRAVLNANRTKLESILNRLVEKGRTTPEARDTTLARIEYSLDIDSIPTGSQLMIEAIVEDLDAKRSVFRKAESIMPADSILATNTSSLPVTAIAAACENPSRVLGMHFFNPAPLLPLVELVPGLRTSANVVDEMHEFIGSVGKKPVIAKDTPGFIVNRVARPFYGEALRILEEGLGTPASIDAAMKRLGGFRMGPFELMDLIGNDINHAVTNTVYRAFFFDPRYRPSQTQARMVEAGLLGRKSGAGFYDYSSDRNAADVNDVEVDDSDAEQIVERILSMLINEAVDAVFWKIGSAADIETAMTTGVNYPKGLLAWGQELGFKHVLGVIDSLRANYGEERYRASPLLRRLAAGEAEIEI